MRILLIGGNGFIGSPLASELRDSGHSVAIFHRSADKSPDKNVVRTRAVSVPAGFWAVHFPVIFVAALFGVIHLGSGIVVVVSAILLGLIAGELRRMSGSLVPPILFHALLNAASALWPS